MTTTEPADTAHAPQVPTPADARAPDAMPPHGDAPLADRRLHPLSWLFVLLQQLKQFIVPLLVLLFVGRGSGRGGGSNELWPLIGVGVLALASLWQYLTYRYRITADSVIVQQGLLQRSHRQIPFSRIHNVTVHQSLLHRLFKVAEVRLESAGGQKPEAEMRVLRMADAIALEALVRRGGSAATHAGDAGDSGARDAGTALLALAPGEVLRLGLVSNRGMLVVGAVAAAASQISPRLLPNLFERWGKTLFGDAGRYEFGTLDYALAVATLAIGFVLLMRMLSMGIALLQYFGFRLDRHGHRLTVERGLLTRLRTSASLRRLQAFTLREGVVHRLLRRRSLDVDTAVIAAQNDQRALRELAPIATAEACDALVRAVLPHVSWPPPAWQALHTHAWWRLALPGAALALALCAGLGWRFGAWGALGLLWLPWAVFVARQHARRAGYAIDDALIAVRAGWWSRHWRFAELDKLQALQLQRSPLDRALGMATLSLDTAGAGAFSQALRIRYLAHADAQALYARCGRRMARRPLRW